MLYLGISMVFSGSIKYFIRFHHSLDMLQKGWKQMDVIHCQIVHNKIIASAISSIWEQMSYPIMHMACRLQWYISQFCPVQKWICIHFTIYTSQNICYDFNQVNTLPQQKFRVLLLIVGRLELWFPVIWQITSKVSCLNVNTCWDDEGMRTKLYHYKSLCSAIQLEWIYLCN